MYIIIIIINYKSLNVELEELGYFHAWVTFVSFNYS